MAPKPEARIKIRAHNCIEQALEHIYDVILLDKTILTTVTKNNEAITEWINGVNADNAGKRNVGFEAEMYIGPKETARAGTVQFCVGNRCLIIQVLNPSSYPVALYRFLTDQNNTFFGLDIESKMDLLQEQYHFKLASVQLRDLGEMAQERYGMRYSDQRVLADVALGDEMDDLKPVVDHSDWGRTDNLSETQVQYACVEAFINLQIANVFSN